MDEFEELRRFPDLELANEVIELLEKNKIPYQIDDSSARFTIVSSNNPYDSPIILKINKKDINKANQIIEKVEQKEAKNINEDHYLYSFSDADIIDVIANQDDWTKLEIALAIKISKQRGLDISADSLKKSKTKNKETNQTVKKVFNSSGWFLVIPIFSILNSLSVNLGWRINFPFGLGITQGIDGIIHALTHSFGVTGIFINIIVSSVFIVFWYYGRLKIKWAIITGLIVYFADFVLSLIVAFLSRPDWTLIISHIWVLIPLFITFKNMKSNENTA